MLRVKRKWAHRLRSYIMRTGFRGRTLVLNSIFLLTLILTGYCSAAATRREVKIPDISGYRTLKCDFHTHTVFSDGKVWPTVRVEEAWREGLDAIALTDHIEYKPHKQDVKPDNDRACDIAIKASEEKGIIVIRGAEITRDMPPGHCNALFLKNANALDIKDFNDVMKTAVAQGAFIFWNHPGWDGQQPDGIPRWYPLHTVMYENGWMMGIEIVNENEYYPLAHKWAIEKKLTIVGNSDIHEPTAMAYDFRKGEHRPMTLVFAKERTEESIKEALLAHRTAVYYKNMLVGEEQYLKAIFEKSIQILNADTTIKGKGKASLQIHNSSDLDFELVADGSSENITAANTITLDRDRTTLLTISGKQKDHSGTEKIRIPYKVKNLVVAPGENPRVELAIDVNFVSTEPKQTK
jgi:3',5'-nucleoside bisphosphate phosphatase